jgi:hypothetical protein
MAYISADAVRSKTSFLSEVDSLDTNETRPIET